MEESLKKKMRSIHGPSTQSLHLTLTRLGILDGGLGPGLSKLSPPEPSVASEGYSRAGPEGPGRQDPVHQFLPCECSGPRHSYPQADPD